MEARRLRHRRIGTEHLLLALLRHGDGAAVALRDAGVTSEAVEAAIDRYVREAPGTLNEEDAAALRTIGVDLTEIRARLEETFGPNPLSPPPEEPRRRFGLRRRRTARNERAGGHLPFSPRSKKVLELSLREAIRLKHKHIGTEHILLGLLRENGGLGARILADADVEFTALRGWLETNVQAPA
ncbi:Clp protease N-terminal domain-containing protein [Plantactinospora sp. GCM10030261]|uniref:Clp protease N-terminal domain-containing protein n=1 Tax=Plantactinospora sp. GCM10030261 TaxID=3273420 RepID=UPI00361EC775